eukprot:3271309-Pyramimonas_sp.AAC.1
MATLLGEGATSASSSTRRSPPPVRQPDNPDSNQTFENRMHDNERQVDKAHEMTKFCQVREAASADLDESNSIATREH